MPAAGARDGHEVVDGVDHVVGQPGAITHLAIVSQVDLARTKLHQPDDGCLQLAGIELRWRGRRHDPRTARGIELTVGNAEGIAGEDAVGAMVDNGLVMQRVSGRVHAFEHPPGQLESLSILGDRDALALDRQDLAIQLRIELLTVNRSRRGDECRGIEHVWRATRVKHTGGTRQRAHERTGAAGMIEVNMREEQVVHRVRGDLQLLERREYQRNGSIRAGIDDGRSQPAATTCAASICGRTYSVSTAVMPSANVVRRGMTAFMACGNIAA